MGYNARESVNKERSNSKSKNSSPQKNNSRATLPFSITNEANRNADLNTSL